MNKFSRRDLISLPIYSLGFSRTTYQSKSSDRHYDNNKTSSELDSDESHSQERGVKNLIEFGGVGDGISDNAEAWRKAAAWASRRSFSGNSPKLIVSAGRYVSSSIPNLAINRLHLQFEGEVWLINSGMGNSFILDGGANGEGVYGIIVEGWPQIYGSSDSSNGIFLRAIFNSQLQLNCRGAGKSSIGLYGEWLVDNKIEFIMSSIEGGLLSRPKIGMLLTGRNKNEDSSYNKIELRISGVETGVSLAASLGNSIHGGSIQNCKYGVDLSHDAWDNKIIFTDFEENHTDIIDRSRRLYLAGCDLNGLVHLMKFSSGARIFGGRIEMLQIDSDVRNALISGACFNRTGSGYCKNHSNSSRFRDVLDISLDRYLDRGDFMAKYT